MDLDADLPGHVDAAGAVLTLRAAQELLAEVVRRSESTVLRVRADGADLVVEVESIDEDGIFFFFFFFFFFKKKKIKKSKIGKER